jgi:hypothetical protein
MDCMRLEPFQSVDDLPFSATSDEVRERCGPPDREGVNAAALHELDYGHVVFRFQASGRLEEVTKPGAVLHLGALAVPFASLESFIATQDPQAFVRAGYVVSPRFGLAFVPGQPPWVTALARHCIDTWRALDA